MTIAKAIWLSLCLLPGFIMAGLVLHYGVNVPHWDQWDTPAVQLIKFAQGTLSFGDLFAQHNEARLLFPRLFFIGLTQQLDGWYVKREMVFTLVLAGLISVGLFRLCRQTLPIRTASALGLLAATNWLLFSPTQWDNWFWGLQIATFIPIACTIGGLLLLYGSLRLWIKFVGCGLLATIATFSFANGLLTWLILLPPVGLVSWSKPRRQWWMPAGWLVWATGAIFAYFYDYEKPAGHPSMWDAFSQPVRAMAFFLAYLGSPFGFGDRYAAAIFGLLLVAGFGLFLGYLLRRLIVGQDWLTCRRGLPWLTIGSYAVLSAMMTTLGRVGFGLPAALAPKYVTFSNFLPIALIYGISLVVSLESHRLKKAQSLKRVGVGIVGLFLVGYSLSFAHGMRGLTTNYQNRIFSRACLMLINVAQQTDCAEGPGSLYPIRTIVEERGNLLNDLGLLRPPLEDDSIYERFQVSQPGNAHGIFGKFQPDGNGHFIAVGWAVLPERRKPADAVLLTYTLPTGEYRLLQVIKTGIFRQGVAKAMGNAYRNAGWQGTVLAGTLPAEAVSISAWAFDSSNRVAYSLGQSFRLQ